MTRYETCAVVRESLDPNLCVGQICSTCNYHTDLPFIPMKQEPSGLFSKDELFDLHKTTSEHCLAVMKKKNHDYTSGGSVFANFKDSSILGVPPVLGILLRCIDKFKRVQTFCTTGGLAVEGEGVLDAFDDVINYMILAKGIILEEQRSKS